MQSRDRATVYTAKGSTKRPHRNLRAEGGQKPKLFNFYISKSTISWLSNEFLDTNRPSEYSNNPNKYSNTLTGKQKSRCRSSASMRTESVLEKYPKLKHQQEIEKIIGSMVDGLK